MDGSIIMPIVIVALIGLVAFFVWKYVMGSKKKSQPLTKDQFERLVSDKLIACKNNKVRITKWVDISGDSIHPMIRHYARYYGSVVEGRGMWLAWKVHWWTARRLGPVTWDLIENWGGRNLVINSNGFDKTGYFMFPALTSDICKTKRYTIEAYHNFFIEYIQTHLGMQSILDTMEQTKYEIQSAMAHKERSMVDLMMTPEEIQYQESPRDMPQEPEG